MRVVIWAGYAGPALVWPKAVLRSPQRTSGCNERWLLWTRVVATAWLPNWL